MKPLANRRPTQFKEWRALWWEALQEIGQKICHQVRYTGRIAMDRDLWKAIGRCERLHDRILVEIEVKDDSFMHTLAEGLLQEIRRRQAP